MMISAETDFGLFIVISRPVVDRAAYLPHLDEHLAYQAELEAAGVLVFSGPLRAADGQKNGRGLICIRAKDHPAALAIAMADPMHKLGLRDFTLEGWAPSEGSARPTLLHLMENSMHAD